MCELISHVTWECFVMEPPVAYAFQCARANPGLANAVLCLRNLIDRGVPLSRALGAVIATFPLGLREIADISAEAQRRYGGVV